MGTRRIIDARFVRATGIARYSRNLVREIVTLDPEREYVIVIPRGRTTGVSASNLREVEWSERAYSLREIIATPVRFARMRPALVHATHYPVPLLRRYPLAVTIHDLAHLRFPRFFPGVRRRVYANVMLRAAARADAVIAPSDSTKRDLVELLGIDPRHVTVVAEGVDPVFAPVPRELALAPARRAGILGDYLLFVGEPKLHKGIDVLLEAIARLAPDLPVGLALAGPLPGPEVLDLAARLRIGDRITLLGHVSDSDLARLYSGALALVQPSRHEGFGLTVLEAMACGTPVIASDAGALPEVAGDAALLVPSGDAAALGRALERATEDAELRRALVEKGHARVRRFSWRSAAAATLAVYDLVERT